MVYHKYIKRGGKVYGPYVYHSRRENGKVITEYHGKKNHRHLFKIFLYIFIGIFLFVGFYSFLTTFVFGITGRASLQLDTDYKPNETLNGVLRLSLQDGELIPADSKVVIDMQGEEYNYALSELVSAEAVEGNFYVKDLNISGKGFGFGKQGAKKSSVDVNFELEIFDKDTEVIPVEPVENKSEESITSPPTHPEEGNLTNEEINNGTTTETTPEQTTGTTETTEGSSGITSQTTQIESEETTSSITSPPAQPEGESSSSGESAITGGTTTQSSTTAPEESSSSESSTSTSTESSSTESSGITGGFVKTITGLVSIDLVESVDGNAKYDAPFEYELPEGKTASIKSGSVSVNGEIVDDSYISISIQNGVAVVSTNYAGDDTGFGQDYLGNKKVNFDIELTKLNLIAKDGFMTIKIIYGDNVIVETSSELSVSLEELEKISAFNEEEFFNATFYQLTKEERDLLVRETGSDVVETKKASVVNDRLVIKYKLGDYWMEFSYDYPGSLNEALNKRIEFERKQWIKNLAQRLGREDSEAEEITSLQGGKFPLNETSPPTQSQEETITNEETNITEENATQTTTEETNSSQNNTPATEEQNITEVSELEKNYSI